MLGFIYCCFKWFNLLDNFKNVFLLFVFKVLLIWVLSNVICCVCFFCLKYWLIVLVIFWFICLFYGVNGLFFKIDKYWFVC